MTKRPLRHLMLGAVALGLAAAPSWARGDAGGGGSSAGSGSSTGRMSTMPGTGGTIGGATGTTNPGQGGTRAPGGAIQRNCLPGTQWSEQARACQ